MRTADMIASMLVAAGASAEFRLATIAAVILTVTAVSGMGAAQSGLAGKPAVTSTRIDRSAHSRLPRG